MSVLHIYAIRNKENGKIYVGSTTDLSRRVSGHFSLLREGKHSVEDLQNDFDKLGRNSFEVRLLETTSASMKDRESFWQTVFGTRYRERGYNYKDPLPSFFDIEDFPIIDNRENGKERLAKNPVIEEEIGCDFVKSSKKGFQGIYGNYKRIRDEKRAYRL